MGIVALPRAGLSVGCIAHHVLTLLSLQVSLPFPHPSLGSLLPIFPSEIPSILSHHHRHTIFNASGPSHTSHRIMDSASTSTLIASASSPAWQAYFSTHFEGPQKLKIKLIRGLAARLCEASPTLENRIRNRGVIPYYQIFFGTSTPVGLSRI